MTDAIVPVRAEIVWEVDTAVNDAKVKHQIVRRVMQEVMQDGHDYGKIGNSPKPTLLKPGAERLCSSFKLNPIPVQLTAVEDWENGFFHYRYRCDLEHYPTGLIVGSGVGSCNSREDKYGWRWVDIRQVPHAQDPDKLQQRENILSEFAFAIEKAETSGQYGKPESYWEMWKEAIDTGDARPIKRKTSKGKQLDAFEMGGTQYRIPNPDVYSIVNTIDKMAQKRALIAAVLVATNASDFFTQDIEDLPEFNQQPRKAKRIDPEVTPEQVYQMIEDEFGFSVDGVQMLMENDPERYTQLIAELGNQLRAQYKLAQEAYERQQEAE